MCAEEPAAGVGRPLWNLQEQAVGGLRVVLLPPRESGYEVARVIWHLDPGQAAGPGLHHALVGVEAVLLSAGPAAGGLTLAEWLESRGIVVSVGRTHFACHLELRGLREAVRGSIASVSAAMAGSRPSEDAIRVARSMSAGSVESADRRLDDRARMALYAAFFGTASALSGHPDGSAEDVARTDRPRVESALRALSRCQVSVVCSDDRIAAGWAAAQPATTPRPPSARNPALSGKPVQRKTEVSVTGPRGSYLLWGFVSADTGPGDRSAMEIAAHALGGWWDARWQSLFREKLGVTYGTRARIHHFDVGSAAFSLASVGMTAKADTGTVAALLETEAGRFAEEGLTELECRSSAGQILRSECLYADSAKKAVARVSEPLQEGLPGSYYARRFDQLSNANPAEVNARLKRLAERMAMVVARGDELSAMTVLNSDREQAVPAAPSAAALRTVQPLVIEVADGKLVISSPLVSLRLKVEPHIVDLLLGARDGLDERWPAGAQADTVRRLADSDSWSRRPARLPHPGTAGGTTAWSFHNRCRDTPFIDNASADAAERYDEYRERVGARPRPANVRRSPSDDILLLPRVRGRYDVAYIDVLQARRTHRHFEPVGIALDLFSDMLHYSFAPLRFADAGRMGTLQLRAAASGGARHETEAFVFAFDVHDVHPGLYWYDGIRHGLVPVRSDVPRDLVEDLTFNQRFFCDAAFGVFTAAVSPRMSWKYPYPRAYKLLMQNVGHVAQVFSMNAAAFGLGASITGAIKDTEADQLLGLDIPTEFTTFALACGKPKLQENGLPVSIRTPTVAEEQL